MRSISLMRGRAFNMAMLPAERWHTFGIAIARRVNCGSRSAAVWQLRTVCTSVIRSSK